MDEALALKWVYRMQRQGLLPEVRENVGLSQAALARAIGVDQSAVSRWERGKHPTRPRPSHALALAQLLEAM